MGERNETSQFFDLFILFWACMRVVWGGGWCGAEGVYGGKEVGQREGRREDIDLAGRG